MEPQADMAEGFGGGGPGTLGGAGTTEERPQASRVEPSDALLDYDRLELASADEPGARGRLAGR